MVTMLKKRTVQRLDKRESDPAELGNVAVVAAINTPP
jgi:hypothetical protein